MNTERVVIRHLRVPLRRPFRTAEVERTASDNVVVAVHLADGTVGHGEGVPRDYVTGETPATCFDFLAAVAPRVLGRRFDSFAAAVEFAAELPFGDDPLRPQCAARSALETALLDAAGRRFGVSLADLVSYLPDLAAIAGRSDEVRYGVVVSAGTGAIKAWLFRLYGFRNAKIKLGLDPAREMEIVERMRRRLGPKVDLRVDVNGAWSPKDAPKFMRRLRKLGISFVEQPIAADEGMRLAEVRRKGHLPVMLDESLVSERDAQLAVDDRRCDAFNLRVSKNGGLIPVLRLTKLARDNDLDVQLGCHPGETGILSAAGRAIACGVAGLRYLEGSYDRHLLKRNVLVEDITFRRGGLASRLTGPGLGVTVDVDKRDAVTVETRSLG